MFCFCTIRYSREWMRERWTPVFKKQLKTVKIRYFNRNFWRLIPIVKMIMTKIEEH